jgi:hypothetical protein
MHARARFAPLPVPRTPSCPPHNDKQLSPYDQPLLLLLLRQCMHIKQHEVCTSVLLEPNTIACINSCCRHDRARERESMHATVHVQADQQ